MSDLPKPESDNWPEVRARGFFILTILCLLTAVWLIGVFKSDAPEVDALEVTANTRVYYMCNFESRFAYVAFIRNVGELFTAANVRTHVLNTACDDNSVAIRVAEAEGLDMFAFRPHMVKRVFQYEDMWPLMSASRGVQRVTYTCAEDYVQNVIVHLTPGFSTSIPTFAFRCDDLNSIAYSVEDWLEVPVSTLDRDLFERVE